MKTLFILLLVWITTMSSIERDQQTATIKATFDGYTEGVYSFTENDELLYEFQKIEDAASMKYDLTDDQYIGKNFNVTYTIETEVDNDDEEYQVYSIVDLKLDE